MNILIIDRTSLFVEHTSILGRSNAFPDVIQFEGVEYFAFRSASTHFPTNNSKIIVLRKHNNTWVVEKEFTVDGFDVRNPKFYSTNGQLRLLFVVTPLFGTRGNKSQIVGADKKINNDWSDLIDMSLPGSLSPYRIRNIETVPVMSAFIDYLNSSDIFAKPEVRFLQENSSSSWADYLPLGAIHLNGTETDFIEHEGKIYFVSRMDYSVGKKAGTCIVCFDKTTQKIDEKVTRLRLDAPYLFIHNGKLYLLARRNVFFKGRFDLLPKWIPDTVRTLVNGAIYWITPKGLALWEIDMNNLTVQHILNYPVQGDTGYAVIQKTSTNTYDVYTYSSVWGKYMPWLIGQLGKTEIVKFCLQFT